MSGQRQVPALGRRDGRGARIVMHRFSLRAWLPQDKFYWSGILALGALVVGMCDVTATRFTGTASVIGFVAFFLLCRGAYVTLRPASTEVHVAIESFAAMLAYPVVAVPLSYVAARSGRPEFDEMLRKADLALGFDWAAWAQFLEHHPWLLYGQEVAYNSILFQPILILLVLPVAKGGLRGFHFMRAILFAISLSVAVFWFFPAAMEPAHAASWYPDYHALRGPGAVSFSIHSVGGIVSFPSFHAASAVLFAYSMRGLGVLTGLIWAFNLTMLTAAPYFGYHYLTDIIAGIGVAVVSIVAAHLSERYFTYAPVVMSPPLADRR
jgi:hypothetical protein